MTEIVDLIFYVCVDEIITDHDGYCSGAENKDLEKYDIYLLKVSLSRDIYNKLCDIGENDKLRALDTHCSFNCSRLNDLPAGSYFCSPSEKGFKHTIRSTFVGVDKIEFLKHLPEYNIYRWMEPDDWIINYPNEDELMDYLRKHY